MTREIVLDTETTGLNAASDRIVEIGCVELINHVPTGRHYHAYLDPGKPMPEEAFRVHGLSDEFLAGKPRFADEADRFAAFIGDGVLVIHNAPFDMGFLNAELARIGRGALANEVIDTVQVARKVHPGARVSLDALCKHYDIDSSRRTLHGALLDSEILAEVYLELIGGRQVALALGAERCDPAGTVVDNQAMPRPQRPEKLPQRLDEAQILAHAELVDKIGENALWHKYAD